MDKSEKLVKIEQRLKKVFHLRNEDSNSNRYRHEDETSESEDSVLSVRHSNSFNNNSSNSNNVIINTVNNNNFDIQSINTSSHSIGNGNSGNTISNNTITTTNNNNNNNTNTNTNNNTILRIIESVFKGDISLSSPPLFNQDTITKQDTIQICESVRRCCENVSNITFEWFEMNVMYELLVVLGDTRQIREAILLGYRECNTNSSTSHSKRTLQLLTSIDTNNTSQHLLQHQLLS
ncbi:hypothetical protein DAPK24_022290 [Pichia kluyveri]|uniref:Uncharacterized protein n=1 Tax=Pichia kluyveri TaxID=36015 RepID=A0AAV5R2B4_PICKL|nr:hypothetical protein DAPK24_022290 [Pichia kluyveri]